MAAEALRRAHAAPADVRLAGCGPFRTALLARMPANLRCPGQVCELLHHNTLDPRPAPHFAPAPPYQVLFCSFSLIILLMIGTFNVVLSTGAIRLAGIE